MKNEQKTTEITNTECYKEKCPVHGTLKVRGRTFKGYITKKFHKRIVIEFERIIYVRKYERYAKKKTKIHAWLPECMHNNVKVVDYVLVGECRPLSKIIHFVFVEKIRDADAKQNVEDSSR